MTELQAAQMLEQLQVIALQGVAMADVMNRVAFWVQAISVTACLCWAAVTWRLLILAKNQRHML